MEKTTQNGEKTRRLEDSYDPDYKNKSRGERVQLLRVHGAELACFMSQGSAAAAAASSWVQGPASRARPSSDIGAPPSAREQPSTGLRDSLGCPSRWIGSKPPEHATG